MSSVNKHFLNLSKRYLFSTIEEKVAQVRAAKPNASILSLGVGDVALPLAPSIVKALKEGAEEMGKSPHGYGTSEGLLVLREKLLATEYLGLGLSPQEIFISEGIARDITDMQEIFDPSASVGIPTPTYPAYFDTATLTGKKITLIPCLEEENFVPLPPEHPLDIIYLCSPNNPTGIALTRTELKAWIDYALEHKSVILFDAAYAAFVHSAGIPKTIYEIPGAKQVAIEFRSFSKSAGFTGLRLGYTVIPKELMIEGTHLRNLWKQRQDIRMNGISYPIQKAGLAALSGAGKEEAEEQTELYRSNAQRLRTRLEAMGFYCYGGEDSPYVWWKTGTDSWPFFDYLLTELHLITIPGSGFGKAGEGFIRLSGFTTKTTLEEALHRLVGVCVTK